MRPVFPRFVFCAGLGLALTAFVQAAPIDADALLKELQAIEDKQKEARPARLAAMAKQFMAASSSEKAAEAAYLQALQATNFDSNSDDAGRFREWRRNHKGMLDSGPFQTAIRLHLRYVAISLAAAANPQEPPVNELLAYVGDVAKNRPRGGWRNEEERRAIDELLDRPIAGGMFARASGIGPDLQRLSGQGEAQGWHPTAGGWREILNTNIRPTLREVKDSRVLQTWQMEIDFDTAAVANGRPGVDKANFGQVELPRLKWAQARDMIVIERGNDGILAMTQIVRTYPDHPDVLTWTGELRKLLENVKAQQGAPATQAAAD